MVGVPNIGPGVGFTTYGLMVVEQLPSVAVIVTDPAPAPVRKPVAAFMFTTVVLLLSQVAPGDDTSESVAPLHITKPLPVALVMGAGPVSPSVPKFAPPGPVTSDGMPVALLA